MSNPTLPPPRRVAASVAERNRLAVSQESRRVASARETDPFEKLVAALVSATRKDQLTWQARENRPHRFKVDFQSGNVEIASVDDDEDSPYELLIFRRSQADYELLDELSGRREPWRNDDLGALFIAARRSARGVTQVVNSMIAELQDLDVPL